MFRASVLSSSCPAVQRSTRRVNRNNFQKRANSDANVLNHQQSKESYNNLKALRKVPPRLLIHNQPKA